MQESDYDKIYFHFKNTGQFDSNLIREYLYEIDKDFDLNIFFNALQILNNPFAQMNPELAPYVGIDYQKIMVDKCFEHFDNKFNKTRSDLTFTDVKDKRLFKNLIQKYPQGIIYF